jgi:tryptophanyl-tRNA synthetase
MSKSHADPGSRILLTDTAEQISKKIMSALTDSQNYVSYDPNGRPGVSNLINIIAALDESGQEFDSLMASLEHLSLKDLKGIVVNSIVTSLSGVRDRFLELLATDDGRYVDSIEAAGATVARENAEETMQLVREATGL